jgi:anthranilate synthase/aminodeoxychorismate synthase-like glutamine amidotransferase
MILIIDNYDSFIYNIARYVSELGYTPQVFRNDAITVSDIAQLSPQAIIISPGPCTPLEAGISIELVQTLGSTIPILGICLGHQAIAQAYGGKIVRSNQPVHGKCSLIHHHAQTIFKGMENPMQVGRYHSLAVEESSLPKDLSVTARTELGEIMAIQHQIHPVFGVQFHPESILTPHGKQLLSHFLQLSSPTSGCC